MTDEPDDQNDIPDSNCQIRTARLQFFRIENSLNSIFKIVNKNEFLKYIYVLLFCGDNYYLSHLLYLNIKALDMAKIEPCHLLSGWYALTIQV